VDFPVKTQQFFEKLEGHKKPLCYSEISTGNSPHTDYSKKRPQRYFRGVLKGFICKELWVTYVAQKAIEMENSFTNVEVFCPTLLENRVFCLICFVCFFFFFFFILDKRLCAGDARKELPNETPL
jgi:hypothetical protein